MSQDGSCFQENREATVQEHGDNAVPYREDAKPLVRVGHDGVQVHHHGDQQEYEDQGKDDLLVYSGEIDSPRIDDAAEHCVCR